MVETGLIMYIYHTLINATHTHTGYCCSNKHSDILSAWRSFWCQLLRGDAANGRLPVGRGGWEEGDGAVVDNTLCHVRSRTHTSLIFRSPDKSGAVLAIVTRGRVDGLGWGRGVVLTSDTGVRVDGLGWGRGVVLAIVTQCPGGRTRVGKGRRPG